MLQKAPYHSKGETLMELIIQEIAEVISLKYQEELNRLFTEERDISEFINATKEMLDGVGAKLVAEALERMDKAVRNNKGRKQSWVVKSKGDAKTLGTIFGPVSYKRTYYENKKTGEYSYLSDEIAGILPNDKLDMSMKARLIEEAIDTPYKRSGEKAAEALMLTSQTVMNTIRELGSIGNAAVKIKEKNRSRILINDICLVHRCFLLSNSTRFLSSGLRLLTNIFFQWNRSGMLHQYSLLPPAKDHRYWHIPR
jgi:hypothetical protein